MGQRLSSSSTNAQTPPPPFNCTPPPPSTCTPPPPSNCTPPPPCKSCNWEYNVFLNFRGDTRYGFTDHLYNGLCNLEIKTFRDSDELRKGNSIAPGLKKAIEESEFAVVVFSPDYATSSWCLEELVHIHECRQLRGMKVLTVFYHVEPTVVRNQTGEYHEAFASHSRRFEDDITKVENWRKALKEIGTIDGWHVKHDRGEADVVKEIVGQIFGEVYGSMSSEPNRKLVGIDAPINKIESYLEVESNHSDVLTVGIWGMGGIGKTTLGDEVFKKISNRFDPKHRFKSEMKSLSDFALVRCLCKSFLGIITIDTTETGIKLLKKKMSQKKVLIFLDDVVNFKQIECLAPDGQLGVGILGAGSRLIITTRDRSSLTRSPHASEDYLYKFEKLRVYEVEKLRTDEARRLLCQTAFKNRTPPVEFETLSANFLQYAGGVPLALKSLGNQLSSAEVSGWPEIMHILDDDRDKDIFSVLQVSFDGLKDTEKNIFLDIACFFYGEDLARVENIFSGFNYAAPGTIVKNLVNKSLVQVNERGERSRLWVDDNAHNYGRRNSWRFVDARDVLMDNLGTDAVEGLLLNLHETEEMSIEDDTFLKLGRLRLLKLYNVDFEGVHPEHVSKHLQIFEWHKYPLPFLPDDFKWKSVVEIKMHHSCIEQLWNNKLSLKMLTFMDLSHCQSFATTPDFTIVPNLERLILQCCNALIELHSTIGDLQKLKFLDLKDCTSLQSLPQHISMGSLQILILSGCSKLKKFSEIGENMATLFELYLDGTDIKEVPESVQHLEGLVLLNLKGCKSLLTLPTILCSSLTSLKFLYLSMCSSMDNLPENIGCLERLEELDACDTAITEVPNSTFGLKSLKLLCFPGCSGITNLKHCGSLNC